MSVLRLPPAILPRFVAFAWPYHRPPSLFVSPARLQGGWIKAGLDVPGSIPVVTHTPESRGGAVRVSQVPGESSRSSALLSDPGRASLALPISARRCCPRRRDHEGRSKMNFGAHSHSFATRSLRFQLRLSLHWQDSLPVGGKPLPGGIRTHWTPLASFKYGATDYPNAPGFAWRHSTINDATMRRCGVDHPAPRQPTPVHGGLRGSKTSNVPCGGQCPPFWLSRLRIRPKISPPTYTCKEGMHDGTKLHSGIQRARLLSRCVHSREIRLACPNESPVYTPCPMRSS